MRILYQLLAVLFMVLQGVAVLSVAPNQKPECHKRKGSCHFGRCPIHLVRVGSCFGFRSCCKFILG
uniref:Beta-defensin-like domain-containing protein n=1 Tax=Anas platyrhynchos TaxID=8839 RepID=A0A8B9QXB7_ANAPL